MGKTVPLPLQHIASWHNVAWALQRAARGKRHRSEVRAALAKPEQTIETIAKSLSEGRLPQGQWREFTIYDPKQRLIHAAPFVDRVAHHALMRSVEPVFERVLLPSVYACRVNKGVHKAIDDAQAKMRRYSWVMHMDIRHYFPNIDHHCLRAQLRRRFRGSGLQLLDAVIDSYQTAPHKGLPIGALSSQHYANHYLNDADRWLLAQRETRAHCRYMDDFLVWGDSAQALRCLRDRFTHYLGDGLKLTVKPVLIQRCEVGIGFCGVRIKPHCITPSQRRRRRYRTALELIHKEYDKNRLDGLQLQRRYDVTKTILLPADDMPWRKHCLGYGAVPDV